MINQFSKPQGQVPERMGNIFSEHRNDPNKIYSAIRDSWSDLRADCRRDLRAENNLAAGITTNFLVVGAITKLGPQVAALKAFSRDNSVDPYKPLATGVQKFNTTVQDGSDVDTDATDFTTNSDSTLTGPTIAVHQYTQKMHLTNAQLNSGVRMADLIEAKLGGLKSKIASIVCAPITVANFATLVPLTVAPAAFGFSDLATLQGQLKKSGIKNVLLDGEYLSQISNTVGFFQKSGTLDSLENAWAAFGWNLLALHTEWAGADPFVRGFACNPQAIGVIAGLPLDPPENGGVIQTASAILPGPNVAIQTNLWLDPNARTWRATYDIMLGAALVDNTAGVIIKSQ
jgi:hypothetical protein